MRKFLAIAAAAALATVAGAASAEDVAASAASSAPVIKPGRVIVTSDGRFVGRIDRVDAARVGVIYDNRYIYIPTSTLSAGEKSRLTTSLTAKEVFSAR